MPSKHWNKGMKNTQTTQEKILAAIEQRINVMGSANKLANSISVSPATITNIRAGKWETISEKMLQKLAAALLSEGDITARAGDWKIYNTLNFQKFTEASATAHNLRKCVMIAAHTGAGKTTALQQYCNNTANAFYVPCRESITARDLIMLIAKAMGLRAASSRRYDVEEEVIANLRRGQMLVIDSAHRLDKKVLVTLGTLAEMIEGHGAIVLAGTEALLERMERYSLLNAPGYREFARRIFLRAQGCKQDELRRDGQAIAAARGVEININKVTCFGTLRAAIEKAEEVGNGK